jgi:hypothetical protein
MADSFGFVPFSENDLKDADDPAKIMIDRIQAYCKKPLPAQTIDKLKEVAPNVKRAFAENAIKSFTVDMEFTTGKINVEVGLGNKLLGGMKAWLNNKPGWNFAMDAEGGHFILPKNLPLASDEHASTPTTVEPASYARNFEPGPVINAARSDGNIKWNGMHTLAQLGIKGDGNADQIGEYTPVAPTLRQLNSFRQYARDAQSVEKELSKLYPAERIEEIMCVAYTAARDFLANRRAGGYEEHLFFNDSEGYRVGELVNKVALSYLWHVYAKGNDTNNAFLSGISRAVIGGTIRTDYLDVGNAQESRELAEMITQADQIATDRRFGRASRSDVKGMKVPLPARAAPLAMLPDITQSLGKAWTSPYYLADPGIIAALDKIEQRNVTLELRVIDKPLCPVYYAEETAPEKKKTKNVLKIAGKVFATIGNEVASQFYTPSVVLAAQGNNELSKLIENAVAYLREGNAKKFDTMLDMVLQYEKSGPEPTTAPEAAAKARRWETIALVFEGIEKRGLLEKKPALARIWKEKFEAFAAVPQNMPSDLQYKKFASKNDGISDLRKIAANIDKPMAIAR